MNPKLTILCESGDAVVDHKTNILNLMWKRSIDKWKKAIGVNRKQHVVHIMNPIEFQEKPERKETISYTKTKQMRDEIENELTRHH